MSFAFYAFAFYVFYIFKNYMIFLTKAYYKWKGLSYSDNYIEPWKGAVTLLTDFNKV